MSYPNNGIAERWIPAGHQAEDPLVIGCTPYVVMLGDKADDCLPPCPEQARRGDVGVDEEFLTTVYTSQTKQAFIVTVNAVVPIAYNQLLYIEDATPTAVILTNDNPLGTLPLWGKVFDFGKTPNLVTPVDNWLAEGDTGTGCVEAVIVECCCPTDTETVCNMPQPANTLVVDANGNCGTYTTIGAAIDALTPSITHVMVLSDTQEVNLGQKQINQDLVITCINETSHYITGAGSAFITNGTDITVIFEGGYYESDANNVGIWELWEGNLIHKGVRALVTSTIGFSGDACIYAQAGVNPASLSVYNGNYINDTDNALEINVTGNVVIHDTIAISNDDASRALIFIGNPNFDIQDCQFIVTADGTNCVTLATPSTGSKFIRNTVTSNTTSPAIAGTWNPATISMCTILDGGGGDFTATVVPAVGATNDTI